MSDKAEEKTNVFQPTYASYNPEVDCISQNQVSSQSVNMNGPLRTFVFWLKV